VKEVPAVALTPNGLHAVTGSWERTARVWDLAIGATVQTLDGHKNRVMAVAVASGGRYAVTWSVDRTARVWHLATGKAARTLAHEAAVLAVVVAPDGRHAVTGSADLTAQVWDLLTGAAVQTLAGHGDSVNAVAVTPDGGRAVTGSWDETARVWDLTTGAAIQTFAGHEDFVNAVAVTPDARYAVTGSRDRTIRAWDLAAGREVACFFAEAALWCCVAGPDGLIAAGDQNGNVYFLTLENVEHGPTVVTAWRWTGEGPAAFGCLHCRVWSELAASALGTELPCPHCGRPVKLNPFVIEADWRPVAAAWAGHVGGGSYPTSSAE
jgi:WD40 repeat protein